MKRASSEILKSAFDDEDGDELTELENNLFTTSSPTSYPKSARHRRGVTFARPRDHVMRRGQATHEELSRTQD